VAGERAVVGASTAGDHGREVRDELTGGDGGAERGREGARKRTNADRSGPRDRERERGGERSALGLAPTGGTRLSGIEDARAWARGLG
jgi:hypothetical protein